MKYRLLTLAIAIAVAASAWGQEKNPVPVPEPGNVTLPVSEYNRLLELAAKQPKKPEPPPVAYMLNHADLNLKATGPSVLGTVLLEGQVLSKAIVKVPLTTGMTVLSASLNAGLNAGQPGKALPLQQEGGAHIALLPGPADFAVTLETGIPLKIDAGRALLTVPAPPAGAVRMTLEIPGDHTNVSISPGLITARRSDNGRSTVEATLVPGNSTTVWWTTREVAAPAAPREVRFLSEVRTLVSVSEAELKLAALAEITVVQGAPAQFQVEVPADYEITGVTGASLVSSESQPGILVLNVSAARNHQFLITMEKPISGAKADVPFVAFKGAQRETGEVLVEGAGSIELTATEGGGLKRMDIKETNAYLRSLAHSPAQAAFRYHRQPTAPPALSLAWVRFPDIGVLTAIAERAVVTTLVTSEGRSLTEVKLTVRNQAKPFLKVELPAGANILSAEVAGENVKPVIGSDGNRVPLLRPGFRPMDAYEVSFVFLHSGVPFAHKGGSDLVLPKMDVPISLLQWEVFLPQQYKVTDFGGDAIAAALVPPSIPLDGYATPKAAEAWELGTYAQPAVLGQGQLGGHIVDPTGAVIPGARVMITNTETGTTGTTATDQSGYWIVSNMPSGKLKVTASAPGFKQLVRQFPYDADHPSSVSFPLSVASVAETVTVESSASAIRTDSARIERDLKRNETAAENAASANVFSLQRRAAGVLPVAIDVPHAGNSYRFVRPLVLDEETKVTFSYKKK